MPSTVTLRGTRSSPVITTTGIRRGEPVGATWAAPILITDSSRSGRRSPRPARRSPSSVPRSTRSRRHVPLAAPVVDLLVQHRARHDVQRKLVGPGWQDRDLIFTTGTGRYLYPDYVSTKFSAYARERGLPHIGGTHGLRDSLASALDANGNGLATISALLGPRLHSRHVERLHAHAQGG